MQAGATYGAAAHSAAPARADDKRIVAVDAVRVIAVFVIVGGHAALTSTIASLGNALDFLTILNQVARFSVPFFFVVSGYFLAARFADGQDPWRRSTGMCKRIVLFFTAWSVLYLIPFNFVPDFDYGLLGPLKRIYWNARDVAEHPVRALWEGSMTHLWFLPALFSCVVITALACRYGQQRLLIAVAVGLYLIGLAGKAYSATPLGLDLGFDSKNGPFFGLLFFVTGFHLYRMAGRERWLSVGIAMVVLGLAGTFVELSVLHRLWNVNMAQDFVLSTYFYGVGVSLMALANPPWLRIKSLAALGPLVFGIYASHMVIVLLSQPLNYLWRGELAWSLAHPFLVFLMTCALTWALARFPVTRGLAR